MLFNSFEFLLFFPIVTIIYFLLPNKVRWLHLLVASCVFYMAFIPIYILILFITIIIDYIAGIMIENSAGASRKAYLVMSIIANVGVLAVFKYYNFLAFNIDHALHLANSGAYVPLLRIILPIGLSFHTFQAMSYTIEVYRGNQKAERHMGIYALYVMFYPQLVAGPIERPQNLLHQFHEYHAFDYDDAVSGLRQMMWGMIKKVVIADRLAMVVDTVYNDPRHNSGIGLAIATILFAFQIFADFSGYSDIAIGAARVMGFKLMTNFNNPYHSKSISEFWRRWHISLSTWFNDYLFTPLTISFRNLGIYAVMLAAIITFLTSGLWHGAAWKYIVWGGLHGLAIAYETFTKKTRKKIFKKMPPAVGNIIGTVFTFGYVCFSYVFFRAHNLNDAFYIISKICLIPSEAVHVFAIKKIAFLNLPALYILGICFLLIGLMELALYAAAKTQLAVTFAKKPLYLRWALYYAGPIIIYYFGVFEKHEFIYFQF